MTNTGSPMKHPNSSSTFITKAFWSVLSLLLAYALLRRRIALAAAVILIMLLPVIKIKKLRTKLLEAEQRGDHFNADEIRLAISRWQSFIPQFIRDLLI
jgi:hypothetical protein